VRGVGLCQLHRSQTNQRDDRARGNRHARGYTNDWARYSRRRLHDHPWCEGYPSGVHARPTLADVTDHIVDAADRPDLFWDPTNHQSLCSDCNKRKAIDARGSIRNLRFS
jgi:5-methylcytosine-specific restriction endonuclease McrA